VIQPPMPRLGDRITASVAPVFESTQSTAARAEVRVANPQPIQGLVLGSGEIEDTRSPG